VSNKTEAEVLDEARYWQALTLSESSSSHDLFDVYRQLVRDNWQPAPPAPPVDPELIEARKMVAIIWDTHNWESDFLNSVNLRNMRNLIRAGYRQAMPDVSPKAPHASTEQEVPERLRWARECAIKVNTAPDSTWAKTALAMYDRMIAEGYRQVTADKLCALKTKEIG
jgi:hypothetical protein